MRPCNSNHQSIHKISVDGVKPDYSEWYECNRCGERMLIQIIATHPQDNEQYEAAKCGIRIVKKYVSTDRSEWGAIKHAVARNAIVKELNEIEAFLIPRSEDLEIGAGYIQQDPEQVAEVRARLVKLMSRVYGRNIPPNIAPQDLMVIIDGVMPAEEDPCYSLYRRLCCMDSEGREWQTEYYAHHPKDGKQVLLNSAKREK